MAAEPIEIRMARLEGAYEQINQRLFELRGDVLAVRSEMNGLRAELKSEISELRRQLNGQFYWLLTFVLGSILIPIIRDLAK